MKKQFAIVALIAFTVFQAQAAHVVEASRDNRRKADLRLVQPANAQGQKTSGVSTVVNQPSNRENQARRK